MTQPTRHRTPHRTPARTHRRAPQRKRRQSPGGRPFWAPTKRSALTGPFIAITALWLLGKGHAAVDAPDPVPVRPTTSISTGAGR